MRVSVYVPDLNPALALLVLALCLVAFACGGAESPGDAAASTAEPEDPDDMGLISAHKALISAMEAGDVVALTALLDPSHDLLVFHPFIENRFNGIGEVDQGLSQMFGELGTVSWTEAHGKIGMEGNVGWVTSHVLIKSPALPNPFVGRGTEIWVHGPGGWRLKHGHWSENAELAGSIREEE
jgi:ketosteroid isomerase-like protein